MHLGFLSLIGSQRCKDHELSYHGLTDNMSSKKLGAQTKGAIRILISPLNILCSCMSCQPSLIPPGSDDGHCSLVLH